MNRAPAIGLISKIIITIFLFGLITLIYFLGKAIVNETPGTGALLWSIGIWTIVAIFSWRSFLFKDNTGNMPTTYISIFFLAITISALKSADITVVALWANAAVFAMLAFAGLLVETVEIKRLVIPPKNKKSSLSA